MTLIPRFIMFKEIGWNDTFYPMIVPNWFGGGAFNIFLVRQFFLTIPRDLDEAAKIDGCSQLGSLVADPHAACPTRCSSRSASSRSWTHWNEFLNALIFLQTRRDQDALDRPPALHQPVRRFLAHHDGGEHVADRAR